MRRLRQALPAACCYMGACVNRENSLKRHKEFHYTYRVGKPCGGRHFTLIFARNRLNKVQVGFSVSKKIGNSVRRNRCKRRLRACFTPFLPQVKAGYNLIFVARESSLDAPFVELSAAMRRSLQHAGLFKERDL